MTLTARKRETAEPPSVAEQHRPALDRIPPGTSPWVELPLQSITARAESTSPAIIGSSPPRRCRI
jgi:hypothetical protein